MTGAIVQSLTPVPAGEKIRLITIIIKVNDGRNDSVTGWVGAWGGGSKIASLEHFANYDYH